MNFVCKRCNKNFSSKERLKTHLQRKNICNFNEIDFSVESLLEELNEKKIGNDFICEIGRAHV